MECSFGRRRCHRPLARPCSSSLPPTSCPPFLHPVHIDFAASKGSNPPVDPSSIQASADGVSVLVCHDNITLNPFKDETRQSSRNSKILSEVRANDRDAIFYTRGHGPVIDLTADPVNIKLASEVGGHCIP